MSAPTDGSGSLRLGGLTSGFDTETIVQQLLAPDRARIEGLEEKKDINVAKVETWTDVAEQLKSFAESVTALRADGTSGNTLFDDKSVASSDDTKATATASSSAVSAEYTVSITDVARAHVIYGSQKATNYTLPAGGNVIINGATITFAGGETLQEMATLINSGNYQVGNEIIASVVDDRMTLQTKNTGVAATVHGTTAGAPPFVNGTDDPNNILEGELGLIDGSGNIVNEAQTSLDASFSVNGIPVTRAKNVIDDVITGVTLTLIAAGSSTLTVSVDTKKVKETITDFIDLYNETRDLIDRIRKAKLSEDDEFGLFHSDPLMRELYNELRGLTTTGVRMGVDDWDGTVTVDAANSVNDTQIAVSGFTAGAGTLNKGDMFTFAGDTTVYRLQNDATIAGNATTLDINPPLKVALTGSEAVNVAIRTVEDFGIGVRTDTVSGVEGVLGILDEGELDSVLKSDIELVKNIWRRTGDSKTQEGVARRLYDFIDNQTSISVFASTTRSIDDLKIDGLLDQNDDLDEQIAILEERMAKKEEMLIRQFSNMEAALTRSQAAGSALAGLSSGQSQ